MKLDLGFVKKQRLLITEMGDDITSVAYAGTPTPEALSEIRRYAGTPITLSAIDDEEFETLLTEAYEQSSSAAAQMAEDISDQMDLGQLIDDLPQGEDLLDSEDDAPIIRLLNALFSEAIKVQASDIHIETFENILQVRFRIDGVLREIVKPRRLLAPLITSRIKVMAKLDIAEKRIPQDGRITLRIAGRPIDVRVSTLPSAHGERIVLRILDKKAARLDLADLGMGENSLGTMNKLIHEPHGIILVTGPTGSGKTTTLYAALTALNDNSRNILTVEEPIEYDLPGIGQTQVNNKVNMTFAKGLRAILRQDPDVVMVGEIRDFETAEIAVQASLTGHLVLSTLHTNSAIGAITRLQDMGVEPYLLSSSLIGVVGQRLVRLLCPHCKKSQPITDRERELLNLDCHKKAVVYHPHGCEKCKELGYLGRTGIYEVIALDETLRNMLHEGKNEQAMQHYARKKATSMRKDGIRRVLAGETSIEELLRVTSDESL